jgi:hypothetical protein
MAYGTVLASFNVEQFGTDGVLAVSAQEVQARVADLASFTRFEHAEIELAR